MLPRVGCKDVRLRHLAVRKGTEPRDERELAVPVVDVEVEPVLPLRMLGGHARQGLLGLVDEEFVEAADHGCPPG
ncbi:MAG: hypothetical protein E6I09_03835 [Chloroflexi bacterium]|nr:MAG: hypothetical protein E6I09_03835 [Chloroflexota bacterium]